ncbi:helix-turn-helix domain-containing protein [Marinobacter salarius]|uniref:helix-turn-helix domain-containing protein n=1 Tax=Marinobacter salarius TaxID=1420917 RepID=UPI003D0A80C8
MPRRIHLYNHLDIQLGAADELTERRAQVLELVARGLTTEDVALKLGISEDTVKSHLDSLRTQFGALNRVELVCQAWAHGVLKASENAMFCILRTFSATLAAPKVCAIDHYTRLAQSRIKHPLVHVKRQKAVAALFLDASPGEADYYEIPAFMRNQLHRDIADFEQRDRQRMVTYVRQVSERLSGMEKIELEAA